VQLGRTVYGGSPKSAYTPTLYQKGLQLGDPHPANFLRLEHRFAFSKRVEKLQLASLSPVQMIGLRPVARDLSGDICGLAVSAHKQDKSAPTDTPYTWMLRQYGSVLRTMLDDLGSPECVGLQLFQDLHNLES
jgi:DNA relaxase NicK